MITWKTYLRGFAGILVLVAVFIFHIDNLLAVGDFNIFLMNIILTIYCLMALFVMNVREFTTFNMANIFFLVFFCLMPPLEMRYSLLYWGTSSSVFSSYGDAYVLVLFSVVAFFLSYRFFEYRRSPARVHRLQPRNAEAIYRAHPIRLIAISLAASACILWYNNFSFSYLFFRGGIEIERQELASHIWLIFRYFVFPLPVVCLVILRQYRPNSAYMATAILLGLCVVFNSPTSMARFQAATLYLAVAYSFFPQILSVRYALTFLILFALLFVFPLLDLFRYFDFFTFNYEIDWSFLRSGHFDGFQSMARMMHYDTITYGRQLLGVFTFFIPRFLWPDKPTGSGAFSAQEHGLVFDNISVNFFAEGYINFGLIGAPIFALILGYLCAKIDKSIYFDKYHSSRKYIFAIFFVGQVFFVLRGDLMNGFGYSMGLFASVFAVLGIGVSRDANSYRWQRSLSDGVAR